MEPRLASESAEVLPGRPIWLGIHWTKMLKSLLMVDRCNQNDLQTESDWRAGPPERVLMRDWQSDRTRMLNVHACPHALLSTRELSETGHMYMLPLCVGLYEYVNDVSAVLNRVRPAVVQPHFSSLCMIMHACMSTCLCSFSMNM